MAKQKKSLADRAPFTRDEIIDDIRRSIVAFATFIVGLGPRRRGMECASMFLGTELDDFTCYRDGYNGMERVPIEEHELYLVGIKAYEHAYQCVEHFDDGGVDLIHGVNALLNCFPHADLDGEPTPLDPANPSKFRQVLETSFARWCLDEGNDLSITELALLANMSEAAVRTSLSAEKIKTISSAVKGEKVRVSNSEAQAWLSGRRGFIPTQGRSLGKDGNDYSLIYGIFDADGLEFEVALSRALELTKSDPDWKRRIVGIPSDWLSQLMSADAVMEVDVVKLEELAVALGAPVSKFVGRAVTAILSRKERRNLV